MTTKFQPTLPNGSILDIESAIRGATSSDDMMKIFQFGLSCKPSGRLRREWIRAVAVKRQEFNTARRQMFMIDRAAGVEENGELYLCKFCGSRSPNKEVCPDETCDHRFEEKIRLTASGSAAVFSPKEEITSEDSLP